MEKELVKKHPTFHQSKQGTNFFRVILLLTLILAGAWILVSFRRGEVRALFLPTPTPTRVPKSLIMEAEAYFNAGKLDDPSNNTVFTATLTGPEMTATAEGTPLPTPTLVPVINDAIEAYQAALATDPDNAQAWAELARIQTYSTNMLRNDSERLERLKSALASAENAVKLAPDESSIRAIYAFVLDWYAYNALVPAETSQEMLVKAEREASRAFQLDPENAMALAFYAEILADQSKWTQAEKFAAQAVEKSPELMDTHRVYAYVLETLGQYNSAIKEYQEAATISPNMTFLYIRIGQNFREGIKNPEKALEYFDRAAKINSQLGVQNSLPYIEIAKTYTQQGQFFAAAVNAEKALSFDSTNAQTYGQLGIIFIRARNFEGALPLLRCSVSSCTAEQNEMGKVAVEGLPLTSLSIAYYYVEYGTVLAFLSTATENYCEEALQVLNKVRLAYSQDPILMSIVEDSEGICRRLENSRNPTATSGETTPGLNTPAENTGTPLPDTTLPPSETPTPTP